MPNNVDFICVRKLIYFPLCNLMKPSVWYPLVVFWCDHHDLFEAFSLKEAFCMPLMPGRPAGSALLFWWRHHGCWWVFLRPYWIGKLSRLNMHRAKKPISHIWHSCGDGEKLFLLVHEFVLPFFQRMMMLQHLIMAINLKNLFFLFLSCPLWWCRQVWGRAYQICEPVQSWSDLHSDLKASSQRYQDGDS